jgi:hypothetical protein
MKSDLVLPGIPSPMLDPNQNAFSEGRVNLFNHVGLRQARHFPTHTASMRLVGPST